MTHPAPKPRKRSRAVPLVALAGAFGLAACEDDRVDAAVFPTAETCAAEAREGEVWFSEADCAEAAETALAEHERSAPRYDDQALCEEQHGGECYAEQRPGGGSVFLPLIAGYMLGNMMSGRGAAQPLYRTPAGGFANAAGTAAFGSNLGRAKVAPTGFRAAPATAGAAPMTRASVARTGGFGASRTGGGFGG